MPKYLVCKNTMKYNKLAKSLEEKNIKFETKNCLNKCSKCHSKIMVKKDDEYISAKSIDKLLEKLDI
ncbi:hypothetical protein [Clostridium akagii]|uniref:hypothetical protein n=1 Tax=Clostridium akagii TaxID=91623 RepID=UPI00047C88E9|nr:hypothetical protein [Clostridium akagii]